ncbi:hypothetical protein EXQ42_09570 [Clostridium botulinum]|nr:hypothetical protein [Clostridium botulinum]MBO0575117.1 hypothetical protein [Clostridium botulinum]
MNDEKLIYSIIKEVQRKHKTYPELDYKMFVNDEDRFIFKSIFDEIEGRYIEKRKIGNEYFSQDFRDITSKGYKYLQQHNNWDDEYPGFNSKLKEWIYDNI